jgi:hypothetical protein
MKPVPMSDILETVLLLALPASGKSEVRRYLAHLSPDEARRDFHMGPTTQLDDFPYVHMMRRIDDELAARDHKRLFFHAPDRPYQDGRDWGTLIELINEDHADLVAKRKSHAASAAQLLFERIDTASVRAGLPARLASLDGKLRAAVAGALEVESKKMLEEKEAAYPPSLDGRTLVIEFARGGAALPLEAPFGYRHSLAMLSPALLSRAVILYVWVTPEESRRKNQARTDPNDPGSILHHGVPLEVMLHDYGCDDMGSLDKDGVVTVEAHGRSYRLPVGRFDNRVDKTSFLRAPTGEWKKEDVSAVHEGLRGALDRVYRSR